MRNHFSYLVSVYYLSPYTFQKEESLVYLELGPSIQNSIRLPKYLLNELINVQLKLGICISYTYT